MRVVMSDVEWYYGRYVLAGIIVLVGVCGGMGIYYYESEDTSTGQASHQENSSDTSQEVSHFSTPLPTITPAKETEQTSEVIHKDSSPSLSDTEKAINSPQEGESPRVIGVGIQGAVQKPGLYWVVEGTRLQELIDIAGGARDSAELRYLNIAALLFDGTTVVIPERQKVEFDGQRLSARGLSHPRGSVISEGGYYDDISGGTPSRGLDKEMPSSVSSPLSKEQSSAEGLIDINHASQEELESLPGIGPVLARAMISYRENQPFQRAEDLLQVPGIGPKRFEKIRPFITVSP